MTDPDRLDGGIGTQHGLDEQTRAHLAAENSAAAPGPGAEPWLLEGLKAREQFLQSTVALLRNDRGEQSLTHEGLSQAAEWILDNFHLAQQSLRQVREDMPRGFYRQLPKLAAGPLRGYPRIYDMAQHLVEDCDARLDMPYLRRFLTFYQEIQPLTIGEIWAFPVMLRWSILAVLARTAGEITGIAAPVEESAGPVLTPLIHSLSGDEVAANCFTSLRTMTTFDWRDFFESVSTVEQILRTDPPDVYAHMDRATRDRYRRVIEELALASGQREEVVADVAITLAREVSGDLARLPGTSSQPQGAADDTEWVGFETPPGSHVGYYLLDGGRATVEDRLAVQLSLTKRLARWVLEHPAIVYVGASALLALLFVMAAAGYAAVEGGSTLLILIAAAVTLMPALAAAIAFVDWGVTLVVPPRILPKLELSEPAGGGRIPGVCRTLVVVPALINNEGT
jgi:cyclic beta-1,2-glucan synthetase